MEHELSDLKVFYGWSRLNKIRKKRAISVIFENCQGARYRGEQLLKRMQDTCYVRKQTVGEAADGGYKNRIFTEYSLFIDEKPFNGDLESVLQCNYESDQNNVSPDELELIRKALRDGFKKSYPMYNNSSNVLP